LNSLPAVKRPLEIKSTDIELVSQIGLGEMADIFILQLLIETTCSVLFKLLSHELKALTETFPEVDPKVMVMVLLVVTTLVPESPAGEVIMEPAGICHLNFAPGMAATENTFETEPAHGELTELVKGDGLIAPPPATIEIEFETVLWQPKASLTISE
jgi:hypothetical protein